MCTDVNARVNASLDRSCVPWQDFTSISASHATDEWWNWVRRSVLFVRRVLFVHFLWETVGISVLKIALLFHMVKIGKFAFFWPHNNFQNYGTLSPHVCTAFVCPHHMDMLNETVADQALTSSLSGKLSHCLLTFLAWRWRHSSLWIC